MSNPEVGLPKAALNLNAKPFVPKTKPAVPIAMPEMAAVPLAGVPIMGANPMYGQYSSCPPMDYYQGYPQEENFDEEYDEEENKIADKKQKKEKDKEKKKAEPKKEPVKKEHKKKEPKEEVKKKKAQEAAKAQAQEEDDVPNSNFVPVDEKRQPLSIVFIGHVDVGKSTICGRIMIIAEKIDLRTIKKYEQEAKEKSRDTWWLAYVMDLNEEERLKGKTVEVGRATFNTETKRYTIFDAPGHQNYIPDMIKGVAMADIGALVIAAKRGEFESGFEGQTLEHMLLAKSLGIQKLILVVNKMDEPSVKWSKDRYEQIKKELTPYLIKYGFTEKNVIWVPVSGLTGANIAVKLEPKICNWYDGPTLMEVLESMQIPEWDEKGPIRIPVLDKMKDRKMDIFGKVESGRIDIGTQVVVMPYKNVAEIVSIQNTDDQLVKYAKPGENIKFQLKGLPNDDYIYKGCILCSPDNLCAVFNTFKAEIKIINMLKHKPIISPGYQCVLHLHTLAEECEIKELLGVKKPKDKDYVKSKYAKEGSQVICIIATKTIIAAEKFEVRKQLGRFTLRDEGKTIAIGTVQAYKEMKEGQNAK